MGKFSPGFSGRRRAAGTELPPGQYLTNDFPVLSAGPTPHVRPEEWEFTITTEHGTVHRWGWDGFRRLETEQITVDLHCVTRWSKLHTGWEGVSLDVLLAGVETSADFAVVESEGGYTANLPMADLRGSKAWLVFRYEGSDLAPEHGGPVRLLVPHRYLWKSAKWARAITIASEDRPGFWEKRGYNNRGDPWREERYSE